LAMGGSGRRMSRAMGGSGHPSQAQCDGSGRGDVGDEGKTAAAHAPTYWRGREAVWGGGEVRGGEAAAAPVPKEEEEVAEERPRRARYRRRSRPSMERCGVSAAEERGSPSSISDGGCTAGFRGDRMATVAQLPDPEEAVRRGGPPVGGGVRVGKAVAQTKAWVQEDEEGVGLARVDRQRHRPGASGGDGGWAARQRGRLKQRGAGVTVGMEGERQTGRSQCNGEGEQCRRQRRIQGVEMPRWRARVGVGGGVGRLRCAGGEMAVAERATRGRGAGTAARGRRNGERNAQGESGKHFVFLSSRD